MATNDTNHSVHAEKVSIYLCTWNVGNISPPQDLTDLLGLDKPTLPDVYGIGLQELSPSDIDAEKNSWSDGLTELLAPKGYIRLKAVKLQGMLLVVFVKRDQLLKFTSVESERSKAGMAGLWGNKGGVSVRFDLNGINLIIVNAHLAAHMNNAAERVEDFFTILDTQKFRDKDVENILDHDYVFWMGDLNFRLDDMSRAEVERDIQHRNFEAMLKNDQLVKCREEGIIFDGFEEGKITFPPTYKFDPGTDKYDTSAKNRVPAWCDRILHLVHEDSFENITLSAKQLHYTSHPVYKNSDHKPVTSLYQIQVFPQCRRPPAVTFQIPDKWYVAKDVDIKYTMRSDADPKSASWDWIGLYKSDFKHLKNYVSYIWAADDAESFDQKGVTLTFKAKNVTVQPGTYRLCYISKYKDSLMGMSEEFKIVP